MFKKSVEIRMCSHPTCQIGTENEGNSTCEAAIVDSSSLVGFPVGGSNLGNKDLRISQSSSLENELNSSIPSSKSKQEAIESNLFSGTDEIIMIIGGKKITLRTVNISQGHEIFLRRGM